MGRLLRSTIAMLAIALAAGCAARSLDQLQDGYEALRRADLEAEQRAARIAAGAEKPGTAERAPTDRTAFITIAREAESLAKDARTEPRLGIAFYRVAALASWEILRRVDEPAGLRDEASGLLAAAEAGGDTLCTSVAVGGRQLAPVRDCALLKLLRPIAGLEQDMTRFGALTSEQAVANAAVVKAVSTSWRSATAEYWKARTDPMVGVATQADFQTYLRITDSRVACAQELFAQMASEVVRNASTVNPPDRIEPALAQGIEADNTRAWTEYESRYRAKPVCR